MARDTDTGKGGASGPVDSQHPRGVVTRPGVGLKEAAQWYQWAVIA